MFEFLFQLLAEFLLQIIGQALAELGLHMVAEPFRKSPDPWIAAIGYTLLGIVIGGVSLLLFPTYFTPPGTARMINLVLTPIAVGGCMMAIGAWRTKLGQPLLRIDRFSYGYLFALSLALVRYWFAH